MKYLLPIHDVIKQLQEAISVENRAVIVAPPGAGKTTIVPLSLLESPNVNGQIIILEPRRLAARAAGLSPATRTNGGRIPCQTVTYVTLLRLEMSYILYHT